MSVYANRWNSFLAKLKPELVAQLEASQQAHAASSSGFMDIDAELLKRIEALPLPFFLLVHRDTCPHCRSFFQILRDKHVADVAMQQDIVCFAHNLGARNPIPEGFREYHSTVPIFCLATPERLSLPRNENESGFREWEGRNGNLFWYHFSDEKKRPLVAEYCKKIISYTTPPPLAGLGRFSAMKLSADNSSNFAEYDSDETTTSRSSINSTNSNHSSSSTFSSTSAYENEEKNKSDDETDDSRDSDRRANSNAESDTDSDTDSDNDKQPARHSAFRLQALKQPTPSTLPKRG